MAQEFLEEEECCPNCGHLTEGAGTCQNCGAILKPDDEFGSFHDDDSSLDDDF
jgi:tRNA(Ile2) C34 agmatinyltransferase TiaS